MAQWRSAQARSVVRVLDRAGEVVGAGFLIGPDLVATCAHVVAEAVGADSYAEEGPGRGPAIDLPLVHDEVRGPIEASVLRWSPIRPDGTGDVAVLRLERAVPAGARMPPLRRVDELWDHRFRVLGFPDGQRDGVWSTGRIRGEQGTRWFQLQADPGNQAIEPGFSGSPVWDEESGAVVGMTVAADRSAETTTAYLIPIDQVLGLDPELLPCPYRGLEAFGEEHAAFFFGRDDDLDRLVEALGRQRLVAVAGPSGVGKSSLVRAGLLPRLRESGVRIVEARAAAGLVPAVVVAGAVGAAPSAPPPEPDGAAGAVRTDVRVAAAPADEPETVLFVDQFEELADAEPAAARELLLRLTDLVDVGGVRIVLTVRWESLSGLMTPPTGDPEVRGTVLDAGSALVAGTVIVGPMDRNQLRQAVVGPADRAPGLSFERGLVDRILDDAGAEPGQLPLVESLLTQLWTRREGGSLTTAAYEAAGGVAGAVAQRAEELLAEFPDDPGHDRLRRIFTFLTRPDREGFVRRPVPPAELAPELRELVPRLVAGRLLVVRPAADGTELLELAHQALIEHWPRLRSWLEEDRDFLAWRAQLGQQRERWEATDQDQGALLRGTALAAAAQWLPARSADVSTADQEYVRRSRARQQREVRRWRVVTAVLAVLVLAAGALAVVAYDRGNDLGQRLRAANAELLGREALSRAPTDPDLAARLALAAWRSDPTSQQARTALATTYLENLSTTAVFAELTDRTISVLAAGADGDVLVLTGDQDAFIVVTGLSGSDPQTWPVPGLPSGSWARLTPDGARMLTGGGGTPARLWDVRARTSVELPLDVSDTSANSLMMGPDGERIAWLEQAPGGRALVVWDLATRTAVPHAMPLITDSDVGTVLPTADPDVIVLRSGQAEEGTSRLAVRSLSTGAELRAYGSEALTAGTGAFIVTCGDGADENTGAAISVLDAASGAQLRTFQLSVQTCSSTRISADERHLVEVRQQPYSTDAVAARVIELTGDVARDVYLPADQDSVVLNQNFQYEELTVVTGTAVLLATGRSMLRLGDTTADLDLSGLIPLRSFLVDGATRVAVQGDNGYGLFDRADGRLIDWRATAPSPTGRNAVLGDSLTEIDDTGTQWRLGRFGPGFTLTDPYDLPAPADGGRGAVDVVEEGDRLYVLSDGLLSRWDTPTRTMTDGPHALAGGPTPFPAQLAVRPGHPDEVAVLAADSQIELWNVAEGRLTGRIAAPPDRPYQVASFAFTPDGERVVGLTNRVAIEVWDVRTQAVARPAIALPYPAYVVGFDADGYLILGSETETAGRRLTFWDLTTGREAGTMDLSFHATGTLSLDRGTLNLDSLRYVPPTQVVTTAGQWAAHLCEFADRPFHASEVDALPEGVDPGSPCRSSS